LGSVGYGWDGDEWTLDTGTPVWRAAARYDIPYVPGRGGHLVTEALINEAIQGPAWRLSRSGGSVGMKMRISERSEAVVDYRIQVRRLVDVDVGALVNGDPWVPYLGLSEDLAGDPILRSEPRIVSGGSFLLVHDKRNDRFNPTSGMLWSTQIEVGDGAFTGDVTMRASAKAERLVMLGPTVVDIVGRGGFGFAQGRNMTLPVEERFFLGGGSSMRGFATDSVGPANFSRRPDIDHPRQTEPVVDALALPSDPGQWIPTGGDAMVSASVELRVPLPVIGFQRMDGTALVLFTDVGHVGFIEPTVVTTSRLEGEDPLVRASFGVGFRIATPVGPASFDIGFNPNPITERNEAWVLPHLSLGVL
jgi:outer membrane protein assembly factor BamA